ncbi:MAG: dUTP diphosphatase [Gammaproteobacteria bacterium]|jgi:dimeric dUTPase (all-alpha-NTP-PPase superfamily)|nr:dUTP diphosphatase [Gammaproteobacteria bacterium]MBT6481683.1 dUTP diphosphatase [Gammaproteobacteria bacterium]MBT7226102.1 dUTP diphosphatase [Gammaproteobacteria bacterium]MDB3909696.1 dUTP diphosphatase [Gammaproteobacteria bacterium]
MLSDQQTTTMLALQAAMNAKVDPNWVSARYPYMRAVVIEAAEAIEHHGWKWWKKQDKDLAQLQMELIDIWHFLLSEILLNEQGSETAAQPKLTAQLSAIDLSGIIEFDGKQYELSSLDLLNQLELLIALSAARKIELSVFAAIMENCELDWTELYCQYVGKNVLNFFRQDHGYQEGTYQKMWNGREDNEYLVDVMSELDPNDLEYKDKLYGALRAHYPS